MRRIHPRTICPSCNTERASYFVRTVCGGCKAVICSTCWHSSCKICGYSRSKVLFDKEVEGEDR